MSGASLVRVRLTQPQSEAAGHHSFPKGHPRFGGRPKGGRNKLGGDVRQEIFARPSSYSVLPLPGPHGTCESPSAVVVVSVELSAPAVPASPRSSNACSTGVPESPWSRMSSTCAAGCVTVANCSLRSEVALAGMSEDKCLISLAVTTPVKINMASGGIGGPNHMSGELFKMMTGVNILHVPYRGE